MLMPNRMMPHGGLVKYRSATGHSGSGPTFTDWVTPKRACIQEKRRLVKNSNGDEVVSTGQVWLDPDYQPPVGSEVTIWAGTARERTTQVITFTYWQHGSGLPEHVELFCL